MTTLVAHDYFLSAEGGGRLCLNLAQALGADLAYGFKAQGHPFFQAGLFRGQELDLNLRSDRPLLRQLRLARGFEACGRRWQRYQRVVYSGFYAPLAAAGRSQGGNVFYCHTPPRFLYDQQDFYLSLMPAWQRPALLAFNAWFRPRFEAAVAGMQAIVANSETVRARLKTYLGRDCFVVNPPCDTTTFHWQGQDPYYLSTARLDSLKRVDIIVEAFAAMPHQRLVVVSGGPELAAIRAQAARFPNIEVLGWVDEASLKGLVGRCVATIYVPRDEDFGMSPVESMAAGKPVIGVAEGGVRETVLPGETGLLVRRNPTPADIQEAVEELTPERAAVMRPACEARARTFDSAVFLREMRQVLELL